MGHKRTFGAIAIYVCFWGLSRHSMSAFRGPRRAPLVRRTSRICRSRICGRREGFGCERAGFGRLGLRLGCTVFCAAISNVPSWSGHERFLGREEALRRRLCSAASVAALGRSPELVRGSAEQRPELSLTHPVASHYQLDNGVGHEFVDGGFATKPG